MIKNVSRSEGESVDGVEVLIEEMLLKVYKTFERCQTIKGTKHSSLVKIGRRSCRRV